MQPGYWWLDLAFCAGVFYLLSFFMGWGLCALLSSDDDPLSFFFAFWIGIAQSSFILIIAGFLGVSAAKSWPAVILTGIAAAAFAYRRKKPLPSAKNLMRHAAFVFFFSMVIMAPVLSQTKALTSFSIGNMDLYDYIISADYLKDNTVKPFLTAFGQDPAWAGASLKERVAAWQIPSTRWVSYYFLSFVSVLIQRDPAELFSLYIVMLLALFIPIVYVLAREIFDLNRFHRTCALLLVGLNPHILYVAFHGFLPQIAGTGFFLCGIRAIHKAIEDRRIKALALVGIFSAAVLGAYAEMFPFLIILAVAYSAWCAVFERDKAVRAAAIFFTVLFVPSFLFPYQAFRFWPTMVFHTQIGGGWDVTSGYYGLFFMLGGFFSHPHFPRELPGLEWAVNPVFFIVLIAGILASSQKGLILAVLTPFLLVGTASYLRDWNYRYFKNFTYCYYWIALSLNHCVQLISERGPGATIGKKILYFSNQAVKAALAALVIIVSIKSIEAVNLTRKAETVPVSFKPLERLDKDARIKEVLIEGVGRWQALWAAYYLRNKIFLLTELNPYMRSEKKEKGKEYPHILTTVEGSRKYKEFQTLFESDGLRLIERTANP